MKYKTIRRLSHYIAEANQSEICFTQNRIIWHSSDFTAEDVVNIKTIQLKIENYLNTLHHITLDELSSTVYNQLKKITPALFYGFALLDEIFAHIKN